MSTSSKAQVLVIDDDIRTRALVKKFLESDGYEVLEASDGNEGIELYQKIKPDIVITDILMPGKSGIEVIEKLRREFQGVKIIAITAGSGNPGGDFLRMSKIMGASLTLKKPLEKNTLLEAVSNLISKE